MRWTSPARRHPDPTMSGCGATSHPIGDRRLISERVAARESACRGRRECPLRLPRVPLVAAESAHCRRRECAMRCGDCASAARGSTQALSRAVTGTFGGRDVHSRRRGRALSAVASSTFGGGDGHFRQQRRRPEATAWSRCPESRGGRGSGAAAPARWAGRTPLPPRCRPWPRRAPSPGSSGRRRRSRRRRPPRGS